MSVQNVRAAIQKFLSTETPQVLCIRGAWGTGKTYTLNDVLKTMAEAGKIPLGKYANVSLFGLNSVADIRREIVQSTIPTDKIGKPFDAKDLESWYESAKQWTKWAGSKVAFLNPDAATAIIEVAAMFARNQLILFDDLERKGKELRSLDVLGFISQLREEKKCKIVLLLNDEQLEDKAEFEAYLEKVVDIYLRFEPTALEIARIAIPDDADEIGKLARDYAVKLGISNVRVIRKIHALAAQVAPLLTDYSVTVTTNAVRTITLFGWSYFQPETAPPLSYLKKVNTYAADKNNMAEDLRWRELLLDIGFYTSTDFDDLLLTGIQNGYFVGAEIVKHARVLDEADIRGKAEIEAREAWDFYHYSFARPADVALGKLYETYKARAAYTSLNDAVQLERLFRELDDERAIEFIDMYVASHVDDPSAFDMDHLEHFGHELTDEVRDKLLAAKERQKPRMTPDELLKALAGRGFEAEILEGTAALPVEEYLRILKTYEGELLSNILSGLRRYLNVVNPNDEIITILHKAGKALRVIAAESAINQRRVMRLGIVQQLDEKEQAPPASDQQDTPPRRGRRSRAKQ